MSKSYLNKVEMKNGQVILFHRSASKNPVYHMRIHVAGMRDVHGTKMTYIQETTGERDLEEARRVALDRYDQLRLMVKDNRPVVELSFADLYALWWADKRQRLVANFAAKGRTGKTPRIAWYEKHSNRYWLQYFGDKKISDLNHAYVQGYWPWRMTYWTRATDAERKRHGNHAASPAKKSMDMEQSALREIFFWANSMKIITYQPIIENPFARKGIAATRRPSFDEAEWQHLQQYMLKWVLGRGDTDVRVNSKHLYQRKLLQIYLHWIAYTGLRTGEVLKLKHADVRRWRTDHGEHPILRISVPNDTKTGERLVRSQSELVGWYEQLCKHTGHVAPTDWLFSDASGKASTGFYKTLPALLAEVGLLTDKHGDRRTAYSLRHYYAESRLRALGHVPAVYDMLCTNMGTGQKQLENHYIRRGELMDEDLLVSAGPQRRGAVTGKTELERARRGLERDGA